MAPPAVTVEASQDAPVRQIDTMTLNQLGMDLGRLFQQYAQDRLQQEQKYVRNLRQFLGIYDPEVEQQLPREGSRAYPRITRVKCISMLSRIMNLMFPGNEDNWELNASPSAEMDPADVKQAVIELQQQHQTAGQQAPLSDDLVNAAVQQLADKRARELTTLIKDQLAEIGGDQTLDYVSLVRQVVYSGIRYGLGVLEGPYVKAETRTVWSPVQGGFAPRKTTIRKPMYEFLPVWDYYPDMSAKTLRSGDGYFIRKVMGRSEVRKLANRPDFFADQIRGYLSQNPKGNYQPKAFENDLKTLGTKINVAEVGKQPHGKYEVIIWKGPVSGSKLSEIGVEIAEDKKADDIEAEVWMIDQTVIMARMNVWRSLGVDVQTVHTFVFDEDDTSPIGNGLPNVVRDSQMSICAATRMALDNASVVCGPILEMNTSLLRPGQETKPICAYQTFERDDTDLTAQFPAIREIKIESHLAELEALIEMFQRFADAETFIGPATGGDMDKMPSEPARTAAGQSMMKGDAALPFKDIIRNFDFFTQSVILSLVFFNRKFNPHIVKEGDYDVVARGATSLVAKEVRGMQTDILAQTLTPEDRDWIDEEAFLRQRFSTRDMGGMMLPKETAMFNRAARLSSTDEMHQLEKKQMEADFRKTLSEAMKNIAQAIKNQAGADAATANTALAVLEVGLDEHGPEGSQGGN
jgi:hypothetical protein